ncbi:MAG: helix-turn-helix domain-containing protein [Candidatus Diapherotrites archaeon]|nr:helix-turn-helix domain-containing protein [Candidatus Diapherotrites archaeon]
MWIAKIRIRHDCVIGNRCRKFNVTTVGIPFNIFFEGGKTFAPQLHTLQGSPKDTKAFIEDLKADKRIKELEEDGNKVFFIETRSDKIPSSFYSPKLMFVKPNVVTSDGFEYWELATWKKQFLTEFLREVRRHFPENEILKIEETDLKDIYFSHLMPMLTEKQQQVIDLALRNGFYEWPKRTSLKKLAKAMGISVATYREHLKRAESKLLPDLIKSIK